MVAFDTLDKFDALRRCQELLILYDSYVVAT